MVCLVAYTDSREPADIVNSLGLVDMVKLVEYIVIRFEYKED
jgi:hypothetical protein